MLTSNKGSVVRLSECQEERSLTRKEQKEEVIELDDDEPISIEETVVQEPDYSASGRLASLRDELDDDKVIERRPLRDRMDDFFND